MMDFVGITISDDPGCGLIKVVGYDHKENGKIVPTYFTDLVKGRIYTIVRSQDEFLNYRSRREELEYFNPFIKMKNALLLMLMCTPIVYGKVVDETEDIVDSIVNDDLNVSQEDVLKKVRIKQYPSEKDSETGEMTYIYKIEVDSNGTAIELESRAHSKIIAMLMLVVRIMAYFDESPEILDEYNGNFDDLQVHFTTLLEKYEQERTLNSKDIKKLPAVETSVEVYGSDELDMFENSDDIGSLLVSDKGEDSNPPPEPQQQSIDVSNLYRDAIPMYSLGDDDDMLDLDLFL